MRAELIDAPYPDAKGLNPAQKAGLRFERSVMKRLGQNFPDLLHSGSPKPPWIRYYKGGISSVALPDAVSPGSGLIVECKLSKVTGYSVENKLRFLYEPLCKAIWAKEGEWKKVIIVKFWRGEMLPLIGNLQDAKPGISYMIWRS